MRVLFIGDIYGKGGREAVGEILPSLSVKKNVDFVIANAENASGGKGITGPCAKELFRAGVDVITLGDHVFDRKEVLEIIDDEKILRPLNLPPGAPGRGIGVYDVKGEKICVTALLGRVFIDKILDCPFQAASKIDFSIPVIVDMHAEATSEKIAMKWFLSGKASAVLGTHTHIPTADEEVINGTAYITDCGMTGPYDSVIGVDKNIILKRFLTGFPARFAPAKEDVRFCAVLVELDGTKAKSIERIQIRLTP